MEPLKDVAGGARFLIEVKHSEEAPVAPWQRSFFNRFDLPGDPCARFYLLCCKRGIWSELTGYGNLKVLLLTNVYFAIAARTRENDGLVRRRKRAREQQAHVEQRHEMSERLVLAIENVRPFGFYLADQKEVC